MNMQIRELRAWTIFLSVKAKFYFIRRHQDAANSCAVTKKKLSSSTKMYGKLRESRESNGEALWSSTVTYKNNSTVANSFFYMIKKNIWNFDQFIKKKKLRQSISLCSSLKLEQGYPVPPLTEREKKALHKGNIWTSKELLNILTTPHYLNIIFHLQFLEYKYTFFTIKSE